MATTKEDTNLKLQIQISVILRTLVRQTEYVCFDKQAVFINKAAKSIIGLINKNE